MNDYSGHALIQAAKKPIKGKLGMSHNCCIKFS
jgi:hypothetical protein